MKVHEKKVILDKNLPFLVVRKLIFCYLKSKPYREKKDMKEIFFFILYQFSYNF